MSERTSGDLLATVGGSVLLPWPGATHTVELTLACLDPLYRKSSKRSCWSFLVAYVWLRFRWFIQTRSDQIDPDLALAREWLGVLGYQELAFSERDSDHMESDVSLFSAEETLNLHAGIWISRTHLAHFYPTRGVLLTEAPIRLASYQARHRSFRLSEPPPPVCLIGDYHGSKTVPTTGRT